VFLCCGFAVTYCCGNIARRIYIYIYIYIYVYIACRVQQLCRIIHYGWAFFLCINESHLMFIAPCITVIVEEHKTNLLSLAILFHLLCTQH